ncbi:TPM domain-containing protein [Mycobacterium sp.]|uniref:TPM domain-containing protein n=1 Tax=Mycobacterium sp. TaxID=1785 RepID=UPI003A8C81D4
MRVFHRIAIALTILTTSLLLVPAVGAQPPARLSDHVTDVSGVLTDSQRAEVNSAVDRLQRDRGVQMWVVYVENFSRFKPENWAARTRSASGMSNRDVLLGVATNTKLYTFEVGTRSHGISEDELNSVRRDRVEPAVRAGNWSGAALAAAEGLSQAASSSSRDWLPWAIWIGVALVALILILLILRARRRRRARRAQEHGLPAGRADAEALSGTVKQALDTADSRMRQISDYVTKYSGVVGAEALARFASAKRHAAEAHTKRAGSESEAIGYAHRASALAAEAQTLANADVLKAYKTRRR